MSYWFKIDKVDKCIANVTVVLHVNRQIKKIVFTLKIRIDFRNEKFFSEFVRNVLYHDSCLLFIKNLIPDNVKLFFVENWERILLCLFSFLLFFLPLVDLLKRRIMLTTLIFSVLHHLVVLLLHHLLLLYVSIVKGKHFRFL